MQTFINDSILATSLLENNAMMFPLANTVCQLHLLLFLKENNFWLLWTVVKTTNHVQVTGEMKHVSTPYSKTILKIINQIILQHNDIRASFQGAQCIISYDSDKYDELMIIYSSFLKNIYCSDSSCHLINLYR